VSPEVREYSGSAGEWDAFVRESAAWTHFHQYGWKRIIEHVFGHECLYLCVRGDEGEGARGAGQEAPGGGGGLRGILPLVRVRSPVFGHYLVSMPFLNYGGPLGDAEAVRALAEAALARSRADGADLLELRSRTELPVDLPVSHRKVTVLLDLPEDDAEILWDALKSKVRSQVRRPRKEGVTIRFGADQVEPFHQVFAEHMRDLGTPAQGLELFRAIAREFPDSAVFGCAYLDGRPVACGCGFEWNGEFEITWASALREYSRIAPNMLLYWSFMERAIERGLGLFNFGRCTPGSGTHRFKQQWGTRDETLWWYQDGRGETEATPSPDEGLYAWGVKVWQRLPVPVATALGPRIVKYIP